MRILTRFMLAALVGSLSASCSLDFGTPPQDGGVSAVDVASDITGDMAQEVSTDVPAEISADIAEDVSVPPGGGPCAPVYTWENLGSAELASVSLNSLGFDVGSSADLELGEVGGRPALKVLDGPVSFGGQSVFYGAKWEQSPFNGANHRKVGVEVYVPQGSVARFWPAKLVHGVQGLAFETDGIFLEYASLEEGGQLTLTVNGSSFMVGDVLVREMLTDSESVDLSDEWITMELEIHAHARKVIARVLADREGPDGKLNSALVAQLQLAAEFHPSLSFMWSMETVLEAGASGPSADPSTATGVGWARFEYEASFEQRPQDWENCSKCEWFRVWSGDDTFPQEECDCLLESMPSHPNDVSDGYPSHDPRVPYCNVGQAAQGYQRCSTDPDFVSNGGMEPPLPVGHECAPLGDTGCYAFQPIEGWECQAYVPVGGQDCLQSTECRDGEDPSVPDGVTSCVAAPTYEASTNEDQTLCECLENGVGDYAIQFICPDSALGTFQSIEDPEGHLHCGLCSHTASAGCNVAFYGPCQGNGPCQAATCDSKDGCVVTPLGNGVDCDDGDPETQGSTCQDGACQGGEPVQCAGLCETDCLSGTNEIEILDLTTSSGIAVTGVWASSDDRLWAISDTGLFRLATTFTNQLESYEVTGLNVPGGAGVFTALDGNVAGQVRVATNLGVHDVLGSESLSGYEAPSYSDGIVLSPQLGHELPESIAGARGLWSGGLNEGLPLIAVGDDRLLVRHSTLEPWSGEPLGPNLGSALIIDFLDELSPCKPDCPGSLNLRAVEGADLKNLVILGEGDEVLRYDSETGTVVEETQALRDALGLESASEITWNDLWASEDGHVFVISSSATGGHLLHYEPVSGVWTQVEVQALNPDHKPIFRAVAGRGTGDSIELAIAGTHGFLVHYEPQDNESQDNADTKIDWSKPLIPESLNGSGDPDDTPGDWNDVIFTASGSLVAGGQPGAFNGPDTVTMVLIERPALKTCQVECGGEDKPEGFELNGCILAAKADADQGCQASAWAPVGTLCDDGDDSTHGDVCKALSGFGETQCQSSSKDSDCQELLAGSNDIFSCGAGSQGVTGCSLQWQEPGAACDDGDAFTSQACEAQSNNVSLCISNLIECPSSDADFKPCFSHWEPNDGYVYDPKSEEGESIGSPVYDCKPIDLQPGSSCDSGTTVDDEVFDYCLEDGSCADLTEGDLESMLESCTLVEDRYLVCADVKLGWEEAKIACQKQGMDLVVIDNEEENEDLVTLFQGLGAIPGAAFWLGLSNEPGSSTYTWSDKMTWDAADDPGVFQAFRPNEPNNPVSENCILAANGYATFQEGNEDLFLGWNDYLCTAGYRFICEKPAECGDGVLDTHLEECDDGNNTPDDGCTPACASEDQGYCEEVAKADLCIATGQESVLADGSFGPCKYTNDPTGPVCWSDNGEDQGNPLPGPFQSVSAGWGHTCGIKDDGSVVCWGYNEWGQSDPPQIFFQSMSAGASHACGVKPGGSIECWGDDQFGQSTPPASGPGEEFVSVSAGWGHTCGVTKGGNIDGRVVCWGEEDVVASTPDEQFSSVSAGQGHTCGVKLDGSVTCWGYGADGQTSPPGGNNFTSVSAAAFYTCGLKMDGFVECWGTDLLGQVSTVPQATFQSISAGSHSICGIKTDGNVACWGEEGGDPSDWPSGSFQSVATGYLTSCGVKTDGNVVCWNANYQGAGSPPVDSLPSVSAGGIHTCGIKDDGSAVCWGDNSYGQSSPPTDALFQSVSAGYTHTCGVTTDGSVACWGASSQGQLSAEVTDLFQSVSAGGLHTCGVKADGLAACWGDNTEGQTSQPGDSFQSVSAGNTHTCGVNTDGLVVCWGDNAEGQTSPPGDFFQSVSAGNTHTCGVTFDGLVACWGDNADGQSGPPAGDNFVSVSAGGRHTCGIKDDGLVACWGDNADGQTNAPAGSFESVSAGYAHTCGVKTDGLVACWGKNDACGDGVVTGSEECDDGDLVSGDGCTWTCQNEDQEYCDSWAQADPCIAAATAQFKDDGSNKSCWPTYEVEGTLCEDEDPENLCTPLDTCDGAGQCILNDTLDCSVFAGPCEYYGCNTDSGCTTTLMPVDTPCTHANGAGGVCEEDGSCGVVGSPDDCASLSFDPQNGAQVLLGEGGNLFQIANEFTLSSWVWRSPGGAVFDLGGAWSGSACDNAGVRLASMSTGGVRLFFGTGKIPDGPTRTTGPGLIPENTWTHLTVTRSGSTASVFIDGSAVTQWDDLPLDNVEFEACSYNPDQIHRIGADDNANAATENHFAGRLAQVAVWNTELAASDISVLYAYGVDVLSGDGLQGYWPLNEGQGTTAHAYGSSAANGTITDAVWVESCPSAGSGAGCENASCIAAAPFHTCALDAQGQAVCWGEDVDGQSSPPAGTFTAITAGGYHTCALGAQGQAVCWGQDLKGESSPPAGTFTAIAAGTYHNCALDAQGQAVCWGFDVDGQSTPPAGAFTAIAAGTYHNCALDAQGQAVCWGSDSYGQSSPPEGAFTALAAGSGFTCALDAQGQAVCWGLDGMGESSPPAGAFATISSNHRHTCALDAQGQAVCWGKNTYEQCNPPEGAFTAIAAGGHHTCALAAQGQAVCWGQDLKGQSTPPANFPNP
jgi:cysteine-rich repeat protein